MAETVPKSFAGLPMSPAAGSSTESRGDATNSKFNNELRLTTTGDESAALLTSIVLSNGLRRVVNVMSW